MKVGLIPLGATALIIGLQSAAISPNLALYASAHLALAEGQIAIVLGGYHFSAFVSAIVFPYITDRFGWRKLSVAAAVLLTSCAAILLSDAGGFAEAMLISVVVLGPSASAIVLYFAYVRSTEGGSQLVVSMRAAFSFAWVLGPAAASFLIDRDGFPLLLGVVALSGVPILILLPFLPNPKSDVPPRSIAAADGGRVVWPMVFAFVLLQATNAVIVMATPLIVTQALGLPITYAGILFSVTAMLEIPLFLFLGRLSDRVPPDRIVFWGALSGGVYYLGMFSISSMALLLPLQFLNAIFVVSVMGAGMAWFQGAMPNSVGLATGLYMNTARIGAMLGTPSAVLFVSLAGGNYQYASLFAGLLLLPALILLRAARR